VTCYEAAAFGFHLYRRFEELGIKNYVAQSQDWGERGKGVKNCRLDAAALCQRLDRYERGNKKAFSPVRIPTAGILHGKGSRLAGYVFNGDGDDDFGLCGGIPGICGQTGPVNDLPGGKVDEIDGDMGHRSVEFSRPALVQTMD